jgi:two-component system sensor histidine kinase UhpB
MAKPLKVLLVEDSENDAILLVRELRRADYEPEYLRVESQKAMETAIDGKTWDIVLSDFVIPGFGGLKALQLIRKKDPDIPFLIVSGQIGEDIAVATMRAGANDYIMKNNLRRLVPAVQRELAEAIDRRERRKAEQQRDQAEAEIRALANRLVELQEEERRSIARELHDETGQYLTLIRLMVDKAIKARPEECTTILTNVKSQVTEVIGQIRNLSLTLRPGMLDDLGLVPALSWLFQRIGDQSGLKIVFEHHDVEAGLPANINTAAYRITQEALTNVIRYAQAKKARVTVFCKEGKLFIGIEDDGRGFNLDALTPGTSTGLSAMRERARLLGGKIEIKSSQDTGTSIKAELPLPSHPHPVSAEK